MQQPVQGEPLLFPNGCWDWIQYFCDHLEEKLLGRWMTLNPSYVGYFCFRLPVLGLLVHCPTVMTSLTQNRDRVLNMLALIFILPGKFNDNNNIVHAPCQQQCTVTSHSKVKSLHLLEGISINPPLTRAVLIANITPESESLN